MTILREAISDETVRFCAEQGLIEYLHTAIDLVHQCFPEARSLRGDMISDPESPSLWVSLTVEISGTVDNLIPRDEDFMARWDAAVPWPASDRIVTTLDVV